jgi:methylmalonyl-CoA epimerase
MSDWLVSHVSIAVSDLEESIARLRLITGKEPHIVKEVADQQVKVAIFSASPEGGSAGSSIELVSPTSEDSPVSGFIAKRGEGLHHLCIYVDDLGKKIEELREAGVRLIDETPRIGAEGKKIAFVHPQSANGVLVELQEKIR